MAIGMLVILLPLFLIIFSIIVVMGIIGVIVLFAGIGGTIAAATSISDKAIKRVSLIFFGSLLLLGISCVVVLVEIFGDVFFYSIAITTIIGLAVVVLGIIGLVQVFNIEKKAPKIALAVMLSISSIIGVIVLGVGAFFLIPAMLA